MCFPNFLPQSRFKNSWYKFLAILIVSSFTLPLNAQQLDVPYVPTPQEVVDKMLEMAEVGEGDYVVDLGSGDGRIVIAAVKRGAYGHGIDLDPERIQDARANAQREGLDDQVMFLQQNIFDTDFSGASVITMYLLTDVNKKIRPTLLESLEPGTRVVSHSFNMGEWEPDKQAEMVAESSGRTHRIYYWVIPANAKGNWSWQHNGNSFDISIEQQFQEVSISPGNSTVEISEASLSGKRISFKATDGTSTYIYSGRIEDGNITGMVQTYNGNDHTVNTWESSRN